MVTTPRRIPPAPLIFFQKNTCNTTLLAYSWGMATRSTSAVRVNGNEAALEITFKIYTPGREESDINRFSEIIGGHSSNLTKAQAKRACVNSAAAWAQSMRDEGLDLGAWDNDGNQY